MFSSVSLIFLFFALMCQGQLEECAPVLKIENYIADYAKKTDFITINYFLEDYEMHIFLICIMYYG